MRILTLTGRAVRAVGNGVTVGSTMTAEVMTLHDTGKTFTDRSTRHIDLLAGDEMFGGDFNADFEEVIRETRNSASFAFGSTSAFAK